MNNNELPYMDPRKFLEPQFIICKFAEHEKRISGLEARLHISDTNKVSVNFCECIHKPVCALLEYGENCRECEEYIPTVLYVGEENEKE